MKKIIKKETFINIFKNEGYRYKLDKIILNFFGLDAETKVEESQIKKEDTILKFIFMVNTEVVLNINVKDTKKLFTSSKIFYINLSYREVEKYHELLIPCYWEIYIPFCYRFLKPTPKLLLIAALFYCETQEEAQKILEKLKVFNQKEIQNILNYIPKNI